MRTTRKLPGFLLLALLLGLGVKALAEVVTGPAADGSAAPQPVVVGGRDSSGKARSFSVNATTRALAIEGAATEDSSTSSGNPFVVAGKDNAGVVRVPNVSPYNTVLSNASKAVLLGGREYTNNAMRHLPLCDDGSLNPTVFLSVGGSQGPNGIVRPLPVGASGSAAPTNGAANMLVTVGGATAAGNAQVAAVDTAGRVLVTGQVAQAGAAAGSPVWISGADGAGNVRGLNVTLNGSSAAASQIANTAIVGGTDASFNARSLGVIPKGSSAPATTNAVMVGAIDGAGNASIAVVETTTNATQSTLGINTVLDTVSPSGVKTSNGTTAVQIVAGVASKCVRVVKLYAYNTDEIVHTFTLLNSNGTVTLYEGLIPASGNLILDSDTGAFQTTGGGDLQFKIDAAGTGTLVKCGTSYVQK